MKKSSYVDNMNVLRKKKYEINEPQDVPIINSCYYIDVNYCHLYLSLPFTHSLSLGLFRTREWHICLDIR